MTKYGPIVDEGLVYDAEDVDGRVLASDREDRNVGPGADVH